MKCHVLGGDVASLWQSCETRFWVLSPGEMLQCKDILRMAIKWLRLIFTYGVNKAKYLLGLEQFIQ